MNHNSFVNYPIYSQNGDLEGNKTDFSMSGQKSIYIHQFYTEQFFSPPTIRKPKHETMAEDTRKFSQDPSSARMVAELTELIPQLSEEIKNMNRNQFMEAYALAMHEKKKVGIFKAEEKMMKAQKDCKAKSKPMERQAREPPKQREKQKNTLQHYFPQVEENRKRTHEVMMSTNTFKTKNNQEILISGNNQRQAQESKLQKGKSTFEIWPKKPSNKISQKLTREIQKDLSDDDYDPEEESKGYKKMHDEDYEVSTKIRYQNSNKSNKTPITKTKDNFRKIRQQ